MLYPRAHAEIDPLGFFWRMTVGRFCGILVRILGLSGAASVGGTGGGCLVCPYRRFIGGGVDRFLCGIPHLIF